MTPVLHAIAAIQPPIRTGTIVIVRCIVCRPRHLIAYREIANSMRPSVIQVDVYAGVQAIGAVQQKPVINLSRAIVIRSDVSGSRCSGGVLQTERAALIFVTSAIGRNRRRAASGIERITDDGQAREKYSLIQFNLIESMNYMASGVRQRGKQRRSQLSLHRQIPGLNLWVS